MFVERDRDSDSLIDHISNFDNLVDQTLSTVTVIHVYSSAYTARNSENHLKAVNSYISSHIN